jgi:spatacsin
LSNEIHFPVLLMGRSLEMLVDVNLAEEGILRLLFAAVYLMLNKSGNDSETSAASR